MKPNPKGRGVPNQAVARTKKKQAVQLVIMLGLLAVLVFVWVPLMGDDETAAASTASLAPAAGAASANDTSAAAPAGAGSVEALAKENDVLSGAPNPDGLIRSPFANFWKNATGTPEVPVEEIKPPTVKLTATAPGGPMPIAVLDGQLRYVGDAVQGWELSSISERRIELRSPNNTSISVEMPLLQASKPLPELVDAPSAKDDDA